MSDSPELVTSAELAKALGLSRRSISRYAANGDITPEVVTPGGRYRWNIEDVKRQLRAKRTGL